MLKNPIVCRDCKTFTDEYIGTPEYLMLTSTEWVQLNAICVECDSFIWLSEILNQELDFEY